MFLSLRRSGRHPGRSGGYSGHTWRHAHVTDGLLQPGRDNLAALSPDQCADRQLLVFLPRPGGNDQTTLAPDKAATAARVVPFVTKVQRCQVLARDKMKVWRAEY